MINTLKTILITLSLILSASYSYGDPNTISIHPGTGVDNLKLGHSANTLGRDMDRGKFLFSEEITDKKQLSRGLVETRFYSYKNSVLGVTLSLSGRQYKQYKKLHKSGKSNFIEANASVSEIKIIPLLGNITARGLITSKSTLNDVLTVFGPLNLKLTEEGKTIKCFTSTIDPSPFNSGEHVMKIHYLSEGIKFEFLIAEKNMLTTITIVKAGRCLLTSEVETF